MDSNAARPADDDSGLGAEVRESFLLLGISIGITAAVTVAAQAALSLLG
ncbi:MAG: hypothetical protein QOJ79_2314 [Actinomycetota bacterium]|jgi:hypothetical protein|nr:hypothetical protein [Actinomycetota bacterium]